VVFFGSTTFYQIAISFAMKEVPFRWLSSNLENSDLPKSED